MYKQFNLGNGLRLTQSDDMGIFLHFKTQDGKESGLTLDRHDGLNPGKVWAEEILANVPTEGED